MRIPEQAFSLNFEKKIRALHRFAETDLDNNNNLFLKLQHLSDVKKAVRKIPSG